MNRRTCRTYPFREGRPIKTLADLHSAVETEPSSPGWSCTSPGQKSELLKTLGLIAEMQDDGFDLEIGEMFRSDFDDELMTYALRPEVMGQCAANHLIVKDQLLQFALSCGWTTFNSAVLQPGDPLGRILNNAGVPDVVHYAVQKAWSPEQFTQADLERWMQEMQDLER